MKKQITKLLLVGILSTLVLNETHAQLIVNIRPFAPRVKVRPACPSPRHVWVTGNYNNRGNRYEYTNGYWALPPNYGQVWVDGHWKRKRRGWFWVPGHWR